MQIFQWNYIFKFIPKLIPYLPVTLEIWILSVAGGIVVGTLFYIIREKRVPVLSPLVRIAISVLRGFPPLTQLFVFYYGLPQILLGAGIDISTWEPLVFVIMAYSLGAGATVMENLKTAFMSVGRGQAEAAYAVGMTKFMAYRRIILPQALTVALPGFGNLCISSLKNTSIAFSVGVIDILARTQQLFGNWQHKMEGYIALAIIYYVLYLIIKGVFTALERRFAYDRY